MTPNISKELKKATETLHAKMLALQTAESDMMRLRDAFVKSTDEPKKEKLKPALIAQAKKVKAAEAEANAADAAFHKILSNEPEEVYDLLDHKIHEHTVRLAVRKIVKEAVESEEPASLEDDVMKFFDSNKKKFEKFADEDEWDEFYELGYEKFPDADQDKVAQALNKAAMRENWFEEEDENEMPTEKDLELAAYGEKNLQKGVNTSDYDKKAKLPKNPENIKESKKK
jgi:hypothetical protein